MNEKLVNVLIFIQMVVRQIKQQNNRQIEQWME